MKPNRRLALRREVMTSLDPDVLRAVAAAGPPDTISGGPAECLLERLLQPSAVLVLCGPTVDPNTCPTLFC